MKATCARAPVRIDLAGGWTDCPDYADEKGGAVVNIGITRYAYATYTPTCDRRIRLESSDFVGDPIEATSWAQLPFDEKLPLHKAILRELQLSEGGHLYSRCAVPAGGGLGSSAAVAVALIGAIQRSRGETSTPEEICQISHSIERNHLAISSGQQDQYGAAFGGFNFLNIRSCATVEREAITVSEDFLREFERLLLVVYTGQSHYSGEILGSVMAAYRQGDAEVSAALDDLKQAGSEMKRALEAEDLNAIGEVMQFNWESQKRLYRENVTRPISNAILEAVFAAARFEGVFGGKVCGAGGGGCVVFLCQPNREHRVREAVEHIRGALLLDCNVDFKGLQTWDVNATESVPLDARLCEVERSREARHSTASSFAHPWTGGALPQPVGPGSRR